MMIRYYDASERVHEGDLVPSPVDPREALLARLTQRLASYDLAELSSDELDAVADRLAAAVPQRSPYAALIGPFYTAAGVARWRGVSRQSVSKQVGRGDVLALTTGNGEQVLPSFQFGAHGEPVPCLRQIVEALGPAAPDPWAQALWMNATTDRFGGRSAAELLRAGDTKTVLDAARDDAYRFSS